MAGYRFCRSDDVPLLVAAHDACWVPYFGPESAITVDDFKRGIRELGLWSSSCMVAFEGDEPIGVLLAAKRDGEANYVWRVAVKPGFERHGHGRHLLTSLADKAAILGPSRVIAEVPAEWAGARAFFARSGFVEEASYLDLVLDDAAARVAPDPTLEELLTPVSLHDLLEHGLLDPSVRRAWQRSPASLRARTDGLDGLAIATDRIEAYVLFRDEPGGHEIVALGGHSGGGEPRLFAVLLEQLRAGGRRVRFPLVGEHEAIFPALATLGFRRTDATLGVAVPRP